MNFCKYRDSLGVPNIGMHKHYYGIAMVDVLATIIGGILFALLFNWNIIITIIVLFILGIILHRLFCVNTTIDKLLFQ